jgi:hypothetical protein
MNKFTTNSVVEQQFEILSKIERVEASPFLLTRIKARLENTLAQPVPRRLAWASLASLVIIFALNFLAVQNKVHAAEKEPQMSESLNIYDNHE